MRLIEQEIRDLKLKILDMAEVIIWQMQHLPAAVLNLDHELARRIRKKEKKIDKFDTKIDKRCERIIALHQPVASDLRFVLAAIKINQYLEQIGDIINGIARKTIAIEQGFTPNFLAKVKLQELLSLTENIVSDSLMAFFRENTVLARTIFEKDDAIDTIHRNAFHLISEQISVEPGRAEDYLNLLMIIKSFEKIADFAVSIAEDAIFHLEGIMYRHSEYKHRSARYDTDSVESEFEIEQDFESQTLVV